MRLHRRLTTIIAAGCLALTTAGCGAEVDPVPKPSTSASTSKRAESKAAVSKRPTTSEVNAKKPVRSDFPRINEKNAAGATASLKYFVEGYRYGLLTEDSSAIEDFSDTDCKPCIEMIDYVRSGKGRLKSATWITEKTSLRMLDANSAQGASMIKSTAALTDDSEPGTETVYIGAQMRWVDGKWKAYNISVEGEE